MIIHPIESTNTQAGVRLSTRVEWERPRDSKHSYYVPPEKLWYEFPRAYANELSTSANSFLVPLVSVAMAAGEDIFVRGEISRQLAHSLDAYQQMLRFWFPEWYSKISIRYETLAKEPVPNRERAALCSFSGGVDSSYTWWSHLPDREPIPAYRVTHALYIEGLNAHKEVDGPDPKIEPFTELLERYGTALIPVKTNARAFLKIHRGQQIYTSFGSILAATAFFFDRIVARYYVAPDNTYNFPILYDMIAASASLLSTETMDIVTHGGSASKIDKMRAISKPTLPMRDHLYVCWDPTGTMNCGECMKCSYTMAQLDMAGVLEEYRTFPSKTDPGLYRRYVYLPEHECYLRAWITYAREAGRHDIARDFVYVLWLSRLNTLWQRILHSSCSLLLRDPLAPVYRLSYRLKQRSPRYARFVARIKGRHA